MAEADTESAWHMTNYVRDIFSNLRSKERDRPIYLGRSPQMHRRRDLINWLCKFCEEEEIALQAAHLSYYLLDIFMDNHDVAEEQLPLLAIGCLSLATKHEDRESRVPRLEAFNKHAKVQFSNSDLLNMELVVMTYMKWNLCWPTAASFIELFERKHEKMLKIEKCDCNLVELKLLSRKYVRFYLGCAARDTFFHKFNPSQVAAACILATRVCLRLQRVWNKDLETFCQWPASELNECLLQLITRFNIESQLARFEYYVASGLISTHPVK